MYGPYIVAAMGLAIFLTALAALKDVLRRYEARLGPALRRATENPWRGVLLGIAATACIQSSSATNAMTVGLVGAGLLDLRHAFAIVLGANIGTTVTGQLIALNVYALAWPALIIGFCLQWVRNSAFKQGGRLVACIGALLYGLWLLGEALQRADRGSFLMDLLTQADQSDDLSLLAGMVLTASVQSSSAVTGMLVGLTDLGLISPKAAIAAALGSNVGTVTTTILASLSAGTTARRVALMDLLFNLFGALLFLPFLTYISIWMPFITLQPGRQVAHAHTLFNVVTVVLAIPFVHHLAAFVQWLPSRRGKE